jgi:hypothetical protein
MCEGSIPSTVLPMAKRTVDVVQDLSSLQGDLIWWNRVVRELLRYDGMTLNRHGTRRRKPTRSLLESDGRVVLKICREGDADHLIGE